ncbi:MAG TPA: FliG C-terminal domain-containing protein [Isosphaeraceae bacterium]|nr:FliG C-terminal domain-containing protein [Isosphaeraceae bacterium]
MSELVNIEELGLLESADLRAVFDQVAEAQVLEALIGVAPSLRDQLLAKLAPSSATRWEAKLHAHRSVPSEAVESAQRAVIEALCRLSRSGQVAFDDPDDMVA